MKPKKNRKNIRWRVWDYRWDAAYFITICTKNRVHYFGKIVNGKMQLSPVGVLVDVLWHEIKHHAENVVLDAFVVMPNHVHGILIINNNDVEQGHALALPPYKNRFQNIGKNSLSSIIGSYKSAVTKHVNRLNLEFGWQTRFHDHVIRDTKSFTRIQNYILQNPIKWENDRFHPNYKKSS